jgi:hypothetical protein
MRAKFLPTIIALLLFSKICIGQITITYPSNRVVFQRNNSNQASVTIAGYFSGCIDRVEARFVPRATGQGTASPANGGWATIQNNPLSGNYYGSMTVTGGWYKLEVRAILDNAEAARTSVERVGVGEVFVVAGQSNATGGDGKENGPSATDDRVSSINFQNYNPNASPSIAPYSAVQLPCPEFIHLDDATKTAPFGNYAWCWGAFGDSLVKKLQVPVMIFNAGWSSTSVRNWKETIDVNNVTQSDYGFQFPAGLPFGHLRLALNNYIAQLGVRAVLWHQGETDNKASRTREAYLSDIRDVIKATRDLSGKNKLAWVVARASRNPSDGGVRNWQPVIDAQNDVIGIGSNGANLNYKMDDVFAGPETDGYFGPYYRDNDEVHFKGTGLLLLAGWWAEKLNTDFFRNSTPYLATPPPNVSVSRTETDNVTFSGPAGWKNYNWLSTDNCSNSLSGNQQWSAASGEYRLKTTDTFNNVVYSPRLRVPEKSAPVRIAGNAESSQQVITSNVNNLLINDCKILAQVTPSANAEIINKTLTAKAYIDGSVQSYDKVPYVQRHFDFRADPANTALAAQLTLYFSQTEFDAFNAVSSTDIPQNTSDQTGKSNLRVIQYTGTSVNNTGTLGSYSGNRQEITPRSVNWNAALNSWEVSLDITASGGFFISTALGTSPLPVTMKYFRGNVAENSAILEWETTAEINSSSFDIERSTDAVHFQTVATQAAAGNSKANKYYSYQDYSLPAGLYYYRLKQVDVDGTYEYSRIISLRINSQAVVKVFPNPVTEQLSIQSEIEINSVEVISGSGVSLQLNKVNTTLFELDMRSFPSGLYVIRVNNEAFKIIKK